MSHIMITSKNLTILGLIGTFLLLSIGAAKAQTCPDNLISYWKLDETGSPATFIDSKGSNNGSCTTECPSTDIGKINGAMYFEGSDEVDVPDINDSLDFDSTDSFSVELWLISIHDPSVTEVLIGRKGAVMEWRLGINTSGIAEFMATDSDGNSFSVQGTNSIPDNLVNDGKWHHIAAVQDRDNNELRLYIDGKLEGTTTSTSYTGNFSDSNPVNMGYLLGDLYYNGILDEIALYNRTLTETEIKSHYYLTRGYCNLCTTPVRIMPVGDSISVGNSSGTDPDTAEYWTSYRKNLWYSLNDAGYYVDFVGSLAHGGAYPLFDQDHEAHAGRSDDWIASNIDTYLDDNPADVVLLHVGTVELEEDTKGVEDILIEIDNHSEDTTVILARIINRSCCSTGCSWWCDTTTTYNNNVMEMAQERIDNGDKIILVDMEYGAGFDYDTWPDGDMWDEDHPYETGHAKMAVQWLDKLDDFMPLCTNFPSDSFADDFSEDTIAEYAVDHTWTGGGIGQFLYDPAGEQAQILTGDNAALQFSHNLPSLESGIFSIDFHPTQKYPSSGKVFLRLIEDHNNYYEVFNSDGAGPFGIKKFVGGVEVDSANFLNEYTQDTTYPITINFSPSETSVEAFGDVITMNSDGSSILVRYCGAETIQQDAYFDNILYNSVGECVDDDDCGFLNDHCNVGVCNNRICTRVSEPKNGDACNDGIDCTEFDICSEGECVGTPNDSLCDDYISCTDDTCNPADPGSNADGCFLKTNNANCDDGDWCNGTESCDTTLGCQDGTPVDCDDGLYCNGEEICDVGSKTCLSGSDPCPDDGLFCNGIEGCDEDNYICTQSEEPCIYCSDNGCTCNEDDDLCSGGSETDYDSDGIIDDEDNCPESDLEETIIIDGCDTGVDNYLFENGCTMKDLITDCADNAKNHGKFVSCVTHLTKDWKKRRLIRKKEEGAIERCAAKSDIPSTSSTATTIVIPPPPECESDLDCDDGLYCNGSEICDENKCHAGSNLCPDDGLFCNGIESCDDEMDACVFTENPCEPHLICDEEIDSCVGCLDDVDCDDGLHCNGEESCVDGVCQLEIEPCLDDELFCNGDEICDEDNDTCIHTGNPCQEGETCDELTDDCLPESPPSIELIPDSAWYSQTIQFPLLILITGHNTHFNETTTVDFNNDLILPPVHWVLSPTNILVFSVIKPINTGTTSDIKVTVSTKTSPGSIEEVTESLALRKISWFMKE